MNLTILYTELADYSIACFKAAKREGVSIQLIHWPVNPEAPFQFDLSFVDEAVSREMLSDQQLLEKLEAFHPDLILCSGWVDKAYLQVCRSFRSKAITVLSLDNHWTGTLKQQLARLASPFLIKRAFSNTFVPGDIQKTYAQKLGFKEHEIKKGFYSADVNRFKSNYSDSPRPNRFLFLGRYVEHKGIFDLWSAYQAYRDEGGVWELWCAGTGDQFKNRIQAEGLQHLGFIQPSEMGDVLKECSAYILPSHFEPWGVSVHEMAVAGFPLILSDKIGAKEMFLKEGVNGYLFKSGDIEALKNAMHQMSALPSEALANMSAASHELGMSHTPEIWAKTLISFVERS